MAANHLTLNKYHLMLMSEYYQVNRVSTLTIASTIVDHTLKHQQKTGKCKEIIGCDKSLTDEDAALFLHLITPSVVNMI